MSNISIYHLSEDIRSEFTIDEQGRAFASRRAVARLAGVADTTIYRAGREEASRPQSKPRNFSRFSCCFQLVLRA